MALLSSSIPTDSEISFYHNIFAARIAKKLGVHTKVQVTDFVSRLATRQHCRAEASESSWGGFCRSTWNQSTLELQVHPLSAWACPSLCIWAPTFWLSSSEMSREVPKMSPNFPRWTIRHVQSVSDTLDQENLKVIIFIQKQLFTILVGAKQFDHHPRYSPSWRAWVYSSYWQITVVDTTHEVAFHRGWATSQRRVKNLCNHRENKGKRCTSICQHKGWLPIKKILDSLLLPQMLVDLFSD